jgi:hypothetical protein
MIRVFVVLIFLLTAEEMYSQVLLPSEEKFHQASDLYINKNFEQALATVKEGLRAQPNSQKLEALKKLLEQEQKKQDQQKKDQENKDQQKKDQQKKDQEQKDQQDKKDQEQKDKDEQKEKEEQEKKDQEKQKKEGDQKEEESKPEDQKEKNDQQKPDPSKKLEEMKISEEKAKMILEAMRNQEKQYLQQQKRKATQPRESNKPDW